MREIKFRAWHEATKDENGDVVLPAWMDYNPTHIIYKAVQTETREVPGLIGFEHVHSGVVCLNENLASYGDKIMQYTGLKDKNGKEIYEGDILQTYVKYGKIGEKWEDTPAKKTVGTFEVFEREVMIFKDVSRKEWVSYLFSIPTNCEVIGNVHENPELLTKSGE